MKGQDSKTTKDGTYNPTSTYTIITTPSVASTTNENNVGGIYGIKNSVTVIRMTIIVQGSVIKPVPKVMKGSPITGGSKKEALQDAKKTL
jgi:hypothetical protein